MTKFGFTLKRSEDVIDLDAIESCDEAATETPHEDETKRQKQREKLLELQREHNERNMMLRVDSESWLVERRAKQIKQLKLDIPSPPRRGAATRAGGAYIEVNFPRGEENLEHPRTWAKQIRWAKLVPGGPGGAATGVIGGSNPRREVGWGLKGSRT